MNRGEARTLVRFVATGVAAAALFAGGLYTLNAWVGLPPFAASACAYVIAFAFSYTTQRSWTFEGRHSHASVFPRYLATQVACLLLSAVLSQALSAVGGMRPQAMSLTTTLAVSAVSFALSRFWVFSAPAKT